MVPWVFFISWFSAITRGHQYCIATICHPTAFYLSRLLSLLRGLFLIECSKSFLSISLKNNSKPVVFLLVFIFSPKTKMARTIIWFERVACIWLLKASPIAHHTDQTASGRGSAHLKTPGLCLVHRNRFFMPHTNVNKEPEGCTSAPSSAPSPLIRLVLCTVFPILRCAHFELN